MGVSGQNSWPSAVAIYSQLGPQTLRLPGPADQSAGTAVAECSALRPEPPPHLSLWAVIYGEVDPDGVAAGLEFTPEPPHPQPLLGSPVAGGMGHFSLISVFSGAISYYKSAGI